MCVQAIRRHYGKPLRGYGVKVMTRRPDGGLCSQIMLSTISHTDVVKGRWIEADFRGLIDLDGSGRDRYRSGFHIVHDEDDGFPWRDSRVIQSPDRYVIVEYEGAVVSGEDYVHGDYRRVVVAPRMRVVSVHTSPHVVRAALRRLWRKN